MTDKQTAAAANTVNVTIADPALAPITAIGMVGDGPAFSRRTSKIIAWVIGLAALAFVVGVPGKMYLDYKHAVADFGYWQAHAGQTVEVTNVTGADKPWPGLTVTLRFPSGETRVVNHYGDHILFVPTPVKGETAKTAIGKEIGHSGKPLGYDNYSVSIEGVTN